MPRIGPYKLANPVALAPMAGVTDLPFRRLCAEMGAGLVVSEMISSNPRLRDSRKTAWRSVHDFEVEPRSVQIAGSEPLELAAAAQYNVSQGAQIIDINMGCPAKKVCKKAAGSALLADEALVKDILHTVVKSVDVPVTLKIRTGANPGERNGINIARIAQDAGIAALAVHGRTRACKFEGEAEYDTIAAIVAATEFPGVRQWRHRHPRESRRSDPPHRRCGCHGRSRCSGQTLAMRPDRRAPLRRNHCFDNPRKTVRHSSTSPAGVA